MRKGTRKGLMTMAATGMIAFAGGQAHADSGASGSASDSPGVLSGNTVQAPVHVPVNVCGDTVNIVGLLNPAVGNGCANGGHGGAHAGGHTGGSPGVGSGNTVQAPIDVPVNACGNTIDIIGIGNPAMGNECGNGGGQQTQPPGGGTGSPPPGGGQGTPPPGGGTGTPPPGGGQGTPPPGGGTGTPPPGGSHGTPPPDQPGNRHHPGTPPAGGQGSTPYGHQRGGGSVAVPQLAHTGSDLPLGITLPVSAGALLAGAVLYRKARASA